MPEIDVNGTTIAYDELGQGSPVVWTTAGWFPRDNGAYFAAGRLSASFRILLWDRPNTGASDINIAEAPSVFHLWAHALHHLLNALDMAPACLIGGSTGSVLSLLMAHLYPQDVNGLVLSWPPTDALELQEQHAHERYFQPADVAEREGIEGVIAHTWIAETISANSRNSERLLRMDPGQFAAIMRTWGRWILSERLPFACLSDEALSQISVPTLVIHGQDKVHPRHVAEALHQRLPNAEWLEYADRYSQEETARRDFLLPFIEEFLQRLESK